VLDDVDLLVLLDELLSDDVLVDVDVEVLLVLVLVLVLFEVLELLLLLLDEYDDDELLTSKQHVARISPTMIPSNGGSSQSHASEHHLHLWFQKNTSGAPADCVHSQMHRSLLQPGGQIRLYEELETL
jgi:hypothetical protein